MVGMVPECEILSSSSRFETFLTVIFISEHLSGKLKMTQIFQGVPKVSFYSMFCYFVSFYLLNCKSWEKNQDICFMIGT